MRRAAILFALLFSGCSCGGGLSREELMDPETCRDCHESQYREWSGSMHAYAASDPLFLAMNQRGQRETGGALGTFCLGCHAPVAVREGATTDGSNLDELPQHLKGVTCWFCHQIDAVEGEHNALVRLADDGIMRGSFADAVDNDAHETLYSPLHDRDDVESSKLCGACHDIVTERGTHLERTFAEWKETLFATGGPRDQLSCAACHMPGREGVAADVPGVKLRRIRSHAMPGVDVALTPFPEMDAQRELVQKELDFTLSAQICVVPAGDALNVDVTLENVAAGHKWPSGAVQDRRGWVELVASFGGNVTWATGTVAPDKAVLENPDPNLWWFGEQMFGDDGQPVHMFWEAARAEGLLLPGQVTRDVSDPRFVHSLTRRFVVPGRADTLRLRVRLRPMDFDVIDDLIASGDLAPELRDRMPTFDLGSTVLEWRAEDGQLCVPSNR